MEDYEGKCSLCKKICDLEDDDTATCDACRGTFCPKCVKKNPVRWADYEYALCKKCFLKCGRV